MTKKAENAQRTIIKAQEEYRDLFERRKSLKNYSSIGVVSTFLDLEAHVLRYWESEFSNIRVKKNRAGNRAYKPKDIEQILRVRYLLYSELYTIEGARAKLSLLSGHTFEEFLNFFSLPEESAKQTAA